MNDLPSNTGTLAETTPPSAAADIGIAPPERTGMSPVAEPPAASDEPAPAVPRAVHNPAAPPPVAEATAASETVPLEHGIGVLVVNLGTPDAADAAAVRRYLKEFLTDPRVIEKKGLFWKFILNSIILPIRSRRKARDYQKIWNREKNESPFKTITRSQAEKLAGILEPLGEHVVVDWAMRYANPSIASRLEKLIARGCDRILVMPLYPQYSAATTATVADEVFRYLMTLRRQPALRIMPAYYDDPYYIEVLASSLKAELKGLSFAPDRILLSYHGMPKDYVLKGDPYEAQCARTTQLLREHLGFDELEIDHDISVALRPCPLARSLYGQDRQRTRQAGREKPGGGDAGFLRRLSGNAGGDLCRERARVQARRRQELRRHSVPQRQRGRHADDLATRHA